MLNVIMLLCLALNNISFPIPRPDNLPISLSDDKTLTSTSPPKNVMMRAAGGLELVLLLVLVLGVARPDKTNIMRTAGPLGLTLGWSKLRMINQSSEFPSYQASSLPVSAVWRLSIIKTRNTILTSCYNISYAVQLSAICDKKFEMLHCSILENN